MMRLVGLALALSVATASPLHCLAEGLLKPSLSAKDAARHLDEAPAAPEIRCMSHCSSPKALLPSTRLGTPSRGEPLRGEAYSIAWLRHDELRLRTKFTIRVTGPPRSSSVLAEQNLPLLI